MVTIGKLSVGTPLNTWFNHLPGIFYYNFDGTYPDIDPVFLVDVPTIAGVTAIGSVFSDGVLLTEVASIAALTGGASFYYDSVNNMLYIRLANYDPPNAHTITGGPVYAFSDIPYTDPSTNTVYESRLRSTVNIERAKDPLFFGKITYRDFTIELDNADYDLYDVQNWDVYGQPLETLYGEETDSVASFVTLKTGKVKEYRFPPGRLVINAQDSRRILTKDLPVTIIDIVTYSDADRDIGKLTPIVYGSCRGVPCRVIDDGAAGATFTFICADVSDHSNGIKAINTVYIDGVETATTATSLANGTLTIATANYKPGQSVTADIDGYVDGSSDLISNPLDIAKDLLVTYISGVEYNSNYFDLTAWEAATLNKFDIGLCVPKKRNIGNLMQDIGASFLDGFDMTPDNRFTWRTHSDADSPIYQVKDTDWKEMPTVEFSSDEAIGAVTVEYSPFWNTNNYLQVKDDDNAADFFQKFKGDRDYTFRTVLAAIADATSSAEDWAERFGDVQILITGIVDLNLMNPTYTKMLATLIPGDNIDIQVNGIEIRANKIVRYDFIGRMKAELLELTVDPGAEEAAIKARFIETYDTMIVDTIPLGYFVLGLDYIGYAGVQNV